MRRDEEGWDEIIPFLWCLVGGDSQCKDGVNESGISPSSKKSWTTSSLVLSPCASLTVPILSPLSPLTRARRHHHARPLPSPPEARRQSPSSIPAARSQSPSRRPPPWGAEALLVNPTAKHTTRRNSTRHQEQVQYTLMSRRYVMSPSCKSHTNLAPCCVISNRIS
jgi:hypothetical protein